MKTDNIFYQIFQRLPSVLFELIGAEKLSEYTFTSIAVKELARTIDGVFVPIDKNQTIYFLEVQFQRDDNLYARLVTEIFMYLGQYKPNQEWKGVVIWAQRNLAPTIQKEYQGLLEQKLIEIIYLDEITQREPRSIGLGIIDLIVTKEKKVEEKVEKLTKKTKSTISDLSCQREIIELIEKVVIYKFPQKSKKRVIVLIHSLLSFVFYSTVFTIVLNTIVTFCGRE